MATLELTIDATGMERGAQQAQQAVDKVTKAAQQSQQTLNKAFQTSGGAIQVAGGIAQTAKAFADLNAQAGLFNTSRVLLEIGKTAQDFREVAATMPKVTRPILETVNLFDSFGLKVGETTRVIGVATQSTSRLSTVFATLNTIMRANPLLLIASAIGAVAGAMSIFGSETQKAAAAYDQLGNSFRKAQLDARTAAYLGVQYKPDLAQQQRDVFSMVQQAQTSGQGLTLQQLQEFGLGTQATRFLAQRGEGRGRDLAQEYMRTGGTRVSMGYGMETVSEFQRGMPQYQLTPAETQAFMRNVYGDVSQRMQAAAAPAQPFSTGQGYGVRGALDMGMQQAMLIAEYKRKEAEDAQRVAENMARAADYAANIGATVGSAFADVLMKTTTLRQAFAAIVASIARQGLSDVGAAIFRGAVLGLTPRQGGANLNIPGGGAGSGATPGGG